jgi:hypothetical protein
MQTYYISGSNGFSIRVKSVEPISGSYPIGSLQLQNMLTLVNSTASLSNVSYEPYESLLSFTASIGGATTAGEYRATLYDSTNTDTLWHGSFQIYASQSLSPKSDYRNQIPVDANIVSNVSTNEYVIL